MQFDVVIVGAGPAGLAAACRLGQIAAESGREIGVCVVEKGAEIGAHAISGAALETRALDELYPDWRSRGAPLRVPVTQEKLVWLLGARRSVRVPAPLVPKPLRSNGFFVASLGELCRWLAEQAEGHGCDILPGFAATDILYEDGRVAGVATGHFGLDQNGEAKPNAAAGYELRAQYVIFAEGCRGNLGRELESRFDLRAGVDPQHYGLGFKEVWRIDPAKHRQGDIVHTFGWPLGNAVEGGGFAYHADDHCLNLGLVIGLNYRNPYLNPFEEFQRWKTHPYIRNLLEGGERVSYGARAVNKGGLQSLPKLTVPGGLLVGCDAGLLNTAKVKGTHTAMKSGMLAAESVAEALLNGGGRDLTDYSERLGRSWLHRELHATRNFSQGIARFGSLAGGALAFVEQNLLRGRAPWTVRNPLPDHARLLPAADAARIDYPAPDGVVSFDRLSSVYLSNTRHEEDQPCHLRLIDSSLPIDKNLPIFDEPAQRYCPAAVYEIVDDAGSPRFNINAANCVHCKTCEIKDPAQNIRWEPPEGGGGPNYRSM